MASSVPDWVNPSDFAGGAIVAAGILGFTNVVTAGDVLSTWVMVIGVAAIFGPRMFRRIVDVWSARR